MRCLQSLLSPTNLLVTTIENNKSSLKGDITEDVDANIFARLNTTEAGGRTVLDRSIVDVRAGNGDSNTTNGKAEVGQRSRAAEDVSTVSRTVLSSADLGIVCGVDAGREEEEGGAGISNTIDGASVDGSRANGVARSSEVPETLRRVHGSVSDLASVGCAIDVAKVVSTRLLVLEIGSEDRVAEGRLGVVEEGLLLGGLDSVDRTEA